MLGGGDWKPSLFIWKIQHLLKSMGFDAGSRFGGGDWKPSLFKWEIQHLLKSMGFDAGSGLGGVDEKSPPLTSESTLLSPTSGVERWFMTLQVCQISMDDVKELGEAFFHELTKQEINRRCWLSWLKVHGCQLGDTVACVLSSDFHHCCQFIVNCPRVLVLLETCMYLERKFHSF